MRLLRDNVPMHTGAVSFEITIGLEGKTYVLRWKYEERSFRGFLSVLIPKTLKR